MQTPDEGGERGSTLKQGAATYRSDTFQQCRLADRGRPTSGGHRMSRDAVLVDADWVESHLDDAGIVLAEVDEDTTAYDSGHIKGAVKIHWKDDLQDPVRRDFVNQQQFEELLGRLGISTGDTVVLY